jgi:hypothetical protein
MSDLFCEITNDFSSPKLAEDLFDGEKEAPNAALCIQLYLSTLSDNDLLVRLASDGTTPYDKTDFSWHFYRSNKLPNIFWRMRSAFMALVSSPTGKRFRLDTQISTSLSCIRELDAIVAR